MPWKARQRLPVPPLPAESLARHSWLVQPSRSVCHCVVVQLRDDDGHVLDAEFVIEPDEPYLAVIMDSRSGGSGSRPPRNPDYNQTLTVLLTRLGRLHAVLVDALVDSRHTRELALPEADRRLIEAPIHLADVPDMDTLRRRMGAAQARIAQAPGALKGGNTTKRMRLRLEVPDYQPGDMPRLADMLAIPEGGDRQTFLLLWNPGDPETGDVRQREYLWKDYDEAVQATAAGRMWPKSWSVGRRRDGVYPRDRAFLLRVHRDRGLVAGGVITSGVFEGPHWNGSGDVANYAEVDWDTILDYEDRLPVETLKAKIPELPWGHYEGSGFLIPAPAARKLANLWRRHTNTVRTQPAAGEVSASPRVRLDWTREEIILAMDFYVRIGAFAGGPIPGRESTEITGLSGLLRELSAYPPERQGEKYRNPGGVYLKLMNLRAIQSEGAHGMNAFSRLDAAVWREYVDDLPRLHDEAAAIRARLQEGAIKPAVAQTVVEDVEIEQQHTENFMVTPSGEPRPAQRAEQKLVLRYRDYMAAKGIRVSRKRYLPAGEIRPIYSDAWVEDRRALIEAKNSDSRDAIRQAIGQLYDYRRFHQPPLQLAVLLPYKPNAERLDLLQSAGIEAVWLHEPGFRDSAHGAFI
jgi:hypothetical protein